MSKSKIKALIAHSYPDISDAVNALHKLQLIEAKDNPTGNRIAKRGKKEVFFDITDKGLISFVSECQGTEKFWKVIIDYVSRNEKRVSGDAIARLIGLFTRKQLNYLAGYKFMLRLETLDELFSNWNAERTNEAGEVIPAQKVIEALAISPNMTLEELKQETGESELEIQSVLAQYCISSSSDLPTLSDWVLCGEAHSKNSRSRKLMRTAIIARNGPDGLQRYALSIVGVLLALCILRYYDTRVRKTDGGFFGRYEPFYDTVSDRGILVPSSAPGNREHQATQNADTRTAPNLTEKYLEVIASNYRVKLPLIFGKWGLLKKVLGSASITNFDIVLDRSVRTKLANESIIDGGVGDYLDAVNKLAMMGGRRMDDFLILGIAKASAIYYRKRGMRPENGGKEHTGKRQHSTAPRRADTEPALHWVILDQLLPLDPEFSEELLRQPTGLTPFFERVVSDYRHGEFPGFAALEREFADGMSFLYYLHLACENDDRRSDKNSSTSAKSFQPNQNASEAKSRLAHDPPSGQEPLFRLLCADAEIRTLFVSWVEQLKAYYRKGGKPVNRFFAHIDAVSL